MSENKSKKNPKCFHHCCDQFGYAQAWGTDNEGYSSAIRQYEDGSYNIGMDLGPIAFCPWCGAKINYPKE